MSRGIGARLKQMAKVLPTLCAIEMCLSGGTLLVLDYLLAGGRHVRASAEGEPTVPTGCALQGLLPVNPAGGSSRVDANNAGPVMATRPAATDGPSVAGES